MRILQVIPAYYPATRYGGPIRSVHGLASALVKRGHDVHVYTTSVDGDRDLDVPLDRPVQLDGVAIHYFRVPALRRLCWCPSMSARLERDVGTFDVAHLHSVFLHPTFAAARAASRAGVPYLVAPRGMLIRDAIRGRSRWVKTAWIQLIERTSLAQSAGLHVTAEVEAEEAKALGLPVRATYCVPNGVGYPAHYSALTEGPFADLPERYALFLSRINWKKGLDRLIAAWQWVPDLPLVIAGNDEEHYRAKLEALAASVGVTERIRFIGPVQDEHKWAVYRGAEMFVLPSYSENFGNVVAEAMAMRCPVVITPEVGLAPFVREVGAGVVASGDPRALAQTVAELHCQPDALRQMGERGARAVRDHLSWDAIAARMEEVYAHSLACGPATAHADPT